MNDIVKIVQALKDSNILLKRVNTTIKMETQEQKGGFLSMLLGTLGSSLFGNLLKGKGIVRAGTGNKKGKGIVRTGTGNKKKRNCKRWYWKTVGFLIPRHPLTNFEIQKYYKNEPRFNGVFSRNNLSKKVWGICNKP